MINLTDFFRGIVFDWRSKRVDRYYWRQAIPDCIVLPESARLCIWSPDGKLGDAVILTTFLRSIRLTKPDWKVILLSEYSDFLRSFDCVEAALPASDRSSWDNYKKLGVDLWISLETFPSNACSKAIREWRPRRALGFSVGQYRLFDYAMADHTYCHPRRHISERFRSISELLGLNYGAESDIPKIVSNLPMTVSCDGVSQVVSSMWNSASRVVFVNTYAAAQSRSFNVDNIKWWIERLCMHTNGSIVLLSVTESCRVSLLADAAWYARHEDRLAFLPSRPLGAWELVRVISKCSAVISPDTAIGHIGAALNLPTIVVFADRHYNPVVWRPMGELAHVVLPLQNDDVNDFDKSQAIEYLKALIV